MTQPAANGWHLYERVHIQARFEDRMLVQYVDRPDIHKNRIGNITFVKPIKPWAWVPVEDVIWDWEIRELA